MKDMSYLFAKVNNDPNAVGWRWPDEEPKQNRPAGRMFIPLELCNIPGIVNATMNYTMSRAHFPNKRTAFIGALAMLSFAASRGYRTEDNTRPALYLIACASSGAGKDEPRKVNNDIAYACGACENVIDTVASGEGLEDAMLAHAKCLLQYDEMDTLFQAISKDSGGTKESIVQKLLTIATSAGGQMHARQRSAASQANSGLPTVAIHPSLSIYGCAVPEMLFQSLNERTAKNGLVARCLIADCGIRGELNETAKFSELPEGLVRSYREIFGTVFNENGKPKLPDSATEKREQKMVPYTPEARAEFTRLIKGKWDKMLHDTDYDPEKEGAASMYARIPEMVSRCALCYAISEDPYNPVISLDALAWATSFVEYCHAATLAAYDRYNAVSEFDGMCKRVMRSFEKKDTRTKRELCMNLKAKVSDLDAVIEALVLQGRISLVDEGVYKVA